MVAVSIAHPPFVIPFTDVVATQTDWGLNSESDEGDTRREPDIKLTRDESPMRWIEALLGSWWSAGH